MTINEAVDVVFTMAPRSLSMKACAARGAAMLDRTDPGWFRQIDLDELDLGDGGRCVLGQLNEDDFYPYGVQERQEHFLRMEEHLAPVLKLRLQVHNLLVDEGETELEVVSLYSPAYLGFILPDVEAGWDGWRRLTEAWKVEIRRRLRQPVA